MLCAALTSALPLPVSSTTLRPTLTPASACRHPLSACARAPTAVSGTDIDDAAAEQRQRPRATSRRSEPDAVRLRALHRMLVCGAGVAERSPDGAAAGSETAMGLRAC
eukprot:1170460-Rhodomonas_salina.1